MATEIGATSVAACCANIYSHPAARWLMGESFHPGGLTLTERVASLAGISRGSRVLDAGSGRGASAVHLAKQLGCQVLGLTLEEEGVVAGQALAERECVTGQVAFRQGDILAAELEESAFDTVLMECVLSIVLDKRAALTRLAGALRPGGRLALTDVTVNGPLPAELQGVLAVAGCVGDARPLKEYRRLVEGAGLQVRTVEDLPEVAIATVRNVKTKLLMAEVGVKLGKLAVDQALIQQGKQVVDGVQRLIAEGTLGYGLLVATKPQANEAGEEVLPDGQG